MANGRRVSPAVKFNGKNVSTSLAYYLKSMTYEDPASGESDTISIELHNIGMRWLGAWAPVQGDEVEAGALFRGFAGADKSAVNFGTFVLDDVEYSGGPLTLKIGAISQPATTGFTATKRTFTWTEIQLKDIAQKIADKYKMTLVYEAGDVAVQSIEQDDQTDSDFLKELCEKYSFALKIFNNKIVIFDTAVYEAKTPIVTLTRSSWIGDSWSYHSELAGKYEACEISYTDPKNNTDIKVRVGKPPSYASEGGETKKVGTAKTDMYVRNVSYIGGHIYGVVKQGGNVTIIGTESNGWPKIEWPDASCGYAYTSNASDRYYDVKEADGGTQTMDTVRCLYLNEKCDSEAEARQKALAALNEANRGITTLSGDIPANPKIFSTSVVAVSGMGVIDGNYFVKKMTLTLDPSGGTTQSLELYKIYEQITDQPAAAPAGGKNVGDIVNFKGGTHYVSSYAGSKGYAAKAGPAKITSINAGQAHPYHLIHTDSSSNVYGWVDEGTF